ncbi:protein FAF-like, chloroplastic [Telopea speciosissima]|uniref:protein FAF-like, chloroplastic n=1 Tax=Telopea speciosissima TaxID=54955 RepID=UPI001CC46554|nr:protein FAF-like, chloroplastic [Telopea speciosissima]
MGFFKKTINTFLGRSHSKDYPTTSHQHCGHIPPNSGCFCLIDGDTQKRPNVVESNAIKSTSNPTSGKKDSSTCSFLFDNASNGFSGSLPSCTESLGFESSDHPMEESLVEELSRSRSTTTARSRWKTTVAKVRKQDKKFPPPLTSMNQNGQRNFYLKPVRMNGRLELTEVSIRRPEVFRACREDGRLRLTTK